MENKEVIESSKQFLELITEIKLSIKHYCVMIFEYLKQHDNVYDFLLEYCEKVISPSTSPSKPSSGIFTSQL